MGASGCKSSGHRGWRLCPSGSDFGQAGRKYRKGTSLSWSHGYLHQWKICSLAKQRDWSGRLSPLGHRDNIHASRDSAGNVLMKVRLYPETWKMKRYFQFFWVHTHVSQTIRPVMAMWGWATSASQEGPCLAQLCCLATTSAPSYVFHLKVRPGHEKFLVEIFHQGISVVEIYPDLASTLLWSLVLWLDTRLLCCNFRTYEMLWVCLHMFHFHEYIVQGYASRYTNAHPITCIFFKVKRCH